MSLPLRAKLGPPARRFILPGPFALADEVHQSSGLGTMTSVF